MRSDENGSSQSTEYYRWWSNARWWVLARSTYYAPVIESQKNLKMMREIDELYLKRSFYGSPRMTDWLSELGVGSQREVARLMRVMGLQASVPGSRPCRRRQPIG